MNKAIIYAVVVTYNRKKLLKECVDALLFQTYSLYNIVIIDNASNDGTEEYLKVAGYLDKNTITYKKMIKNIGGAGGFFYGMKMAYEKGAEWIWIMDDDSEPLRDSLEKIAQSINLNREKCIIAPKIVDNYNNICYATRGDLSFKNSFNNIFRFPINKSIYNKNISDISFVSFVGPLIHRDVISKIGYPNKKLFIYNDDVEYSIRAYKHAVEIKLISNSIIRHKYNEIEKNFRKSKYLCFTSKHPRTNIKYLWKYYYSNRNIIYLCKRYQSDKLKFYISFTIWGAKAVGGIILYDDFKIRRLKLLLKATIDGFTGTLGSLNSRPN